MDSKFREQVTRAKRIARAVGPQAVFLKQAERARQYARRGMLKNAITVDDTGSVLRFVRTKSYNDLQDRAYLNKRGYAIGTINGEKVMVVSGSRNVYDWVFNITDTVTPAKLQPSRITSKRLSKIAKDNGVDVVVGHSRGAKLVSDMDGDFKKLGLDGAMMLARRGRKDMMNVSQGQPFDRLIAAGGKRNHFVRTKRVGKVHYVSRDYRGYKQRYRRRRRPADAFVRPFFNPYS